MNSFCHERHDHDFDHDHSFRFDNSIVVVSSVPRNGQTGVSPNIKSIKLVLDRHFNDGWDWNNGCIEIDMWRGTLCSGLHLVPIRIQRSRESCGGRRIIYVIPVNHLRGGTTYRIRIKSISFDRNGVKTTKYKLITFTTACR